MSITDICTRHLWYMSIIDNWSKRCAPYERPLQLRLVGNIATPNLIIGYRIIDSRLVTTRKQNTLCLSRIRFTTTLPQTLHQSWSGCLDTAKCLDSWTRVVDSGIYYTQLSIISRMNFLLRFKPSPWSSIDWRLRLLKPQVYATINYYICLLHGYITDRYYGFQWQASINIIIIVMYYWLLQQLSGIEGHDGWDNQLCWAAWNRFWNMSCYRYLIQMYVTDGCFGCQ
jgi:hypothetical protein